MIIRKSVEKSFTTLESKIPTNISEDYLIEQLEDSNTEVSVTSGMSSGMTSGFKSEKVKYLSLDIQNFL